MDSSDSHNSSSSLSDSHKNEIGVFLFKKFFNRIDCATPSTLREDSIRDDEARCALDIAQRYYKKDRPDPALIELCSRTLASVLEPHHDIKIVKQYLDQLSLKVVEVLTRQSETFRPFLDILIESGVYPDPDVVYRSPSLGQPMDEIVAERAWNTKYQGRAHATLLANIQTSFKVGVAYTNSGAIIQSSGFGKSRTVDQMATLIPTIPMNIRDSGDASHGAFPPTDATLIDIFSRMSSSKNPVHSLLVFFKVLFQLVRHLVQDMPKQLITAHLHGYLSSWDNRAKLFNDLSGKLESELQHDSDEDAAKEAVISFRELDKLFPKSKEPVKMVIYLDEAHVLLAMSHKGISMYDHMLKATTEFRNVGIFLLFLSTASRIEDLATQPNLSNSARYQVAHDLVAPFTEMPFDCHPSLVNETIGNRLMLQDVQKFSFAVRFGRPLFWAYYESITGKEEETARAEILDMAKGKLTAKKSLSDKLENPAKLVILDILLNLEYDPQRTHTNRLASTMVASHMRTVFSIPPSRAYMHTGYPSEPVLAEAALTLANDIGQTTSLGPLLSFFRDLDDETAGAIDKGERGENMGKMILLLAYIAAMKNSPSGTRFWGDGCSLIDLLTELTGADFIEDVKVSQPDNLTGGATLEKSFKNSWVRFTHFARSKDNSAMTTTMAWIAFLRGMAMIGWRSQEAVDVSIPILLDKTKPISEANCSSIAVQIKLQEECTPQSQSSILEKRMKLFPPPNSRRDASAGATEAEKKAYHSRPYISLVMELGLVATSNSAVIPSMVVDRLDNLPPASKGQHKSKSFVPNVYIPPSPTKAVPSRSSHHPEVHPRYSLFYYGCSHKVYKCIPDTSEAEGACRALLQTSNVFNDRPPRPIDPVLQMKPFWNVGLNCYSWVNEPYFKPPYPSQPTELGNDEVLVKNADANVDADQEEADKGGNPRRAKRARVDDNGPDNHGTAESGRMDEGS